MSAHTAQLILMAFGFLACLFLGWAPMIRKEVLWICCAAPAIAIGIVTALLWAVFIGAAALGDVPHDVPFVSLLLPPTLVTPAYGYYLWVTHTPSPAARAQIETPPGRPVEALPTFEEAYQRLRQAQGVSRSAGWEFLDDQDELDY